jgi:hypothetical protein
MVAHGGILAPFNKAAGGKGRSRHKGLNVPARGSIYKEYVKVSERFVEKDETPKALFEVAGPLETAVTEAPPLRAQIRDAERVWPPYNFDELLGRAATLERLGNAVGGVNPRLPGWHNDLIQLVKKLVARSLDWYTRPLHEFNTSVSRSLEEAVGAIDRLSMDVVALQARLAQSERKGAALVQLIQERCRIETEFDGRFRENSGFYVEADPPNDRTAYVIGLFGTGRRYINKLIVDNIGHRAKYFRDTIRLHPGPTPMIYSGHATIRHACRGQELPDVMSRILDAVKSGYANLIFIYRHPLDSLLTNWVWWRTFLRHHRRISGISEIYESTSDLCADLEQNFLEFKAFAESDPDFFAGTPGPRFLSFAQFVEETELHFQSATVTLRLEDFMIDPLREFSKIAEVMSVNLDLSRLCIAPPRTRSYGYLAVKDKVPRFRNFIGELNAETRARIERIGYQVTG